MRLEGRNLTFSYGQESPVLENYNLFIDSGEVVGLLGKSGRGKSTLGKLLSGYVVPQEGQVLLEGEPLPKKGFCPVQLIYQHPEQAVNPTMKVKRLLKESGGLSLSQVGLSESLSSRYPTQLSGGQLQRVCIARSLTDKSKFIIADEMTTMLDAVTQREIWSFFLKEVKERNIGVLVITHNVHLAEKVCDRMIYL